MFFAQEIEVDPGADRERAAAVVGSAELTLRNMYVYTYGMLRMKTAPPPTRAIDDIVQEVNLITTAWPGESHCA